MKKSTWYLIILILFSMMVGAAIVYVLKLSPKTESLCAVNANREEDLSVALTQGYQAQGLTFGYPDSLEIVAQDDSAASTVLVHLQSTDQSSIINSITNQTVTEPLISLEVSRVPNSEKLSLADYINRNSDITAEKVRTRSDVNGNLGISQWVWLQNDPLKYSIITYYILADDFVWQLRARIFNSDPTSHGFRKANQIINQIFDSVTMS